MTSRKPNSEPADLGDEQPGPTPPLEDPPELTPEDFEHAIRSDRRARIINGKLEPGDVAALRRFVRLSPEQFAEAFGVSAKTLSGWEEDRVKPKGTALALMRIAARHPHAIRRLVSSKD